MVPVRDPNCGYAETETKVVEYEVPLYDQENYSLCWAFCQVMIEAYQEGADFTQKQATRKAKKIARRVHSFFNWNLSGWPTNLGDSVSISDIDSLYDVLVENGPVYALYSNATATSTATTAHLVVVTGVNCSSNLVYTNNPWGVRGEQSFAEFTAGVAWDVPNMYGMTFQKVFLVN